MSYLDGARRIDLDALQSRFALRVTARLSERSLDLPHDLNERLRVAREQALQRARQARQARPALATAGLSTTPSGLAVARGPSWGLRLASMAPLLMLVLGLVFIQHLHQQAEIRAAADVDAALLADDLPPQAYGDPGFVAFLKQPGP